MADSSSSKVPYSSSKPLYYGSSKRSPLYYGGTKGPVYYGSSKSPMYYGGAGGAPYYAGGHAPYYYGGRGGEGGDESLVGTVTLSRVLRVISQRWISVLVILLIGLVVAFAVFRISPTIYEAQSEFTMDTRRPQVVGGMSTGTDMEMYGTTYAEIFNTRLSDWCSEKIVTKIVQQYRANYPASTVTDSEIISVLSGAKLDLVRNSRLITISLRSSQAQLAAALANAYAEAIETFTDDENKLRCDKAVSQIHEQTEKQRRVDADVAKRLLEFRTSHKIDALTADRDVIQQSLSKITGDILALETEVTSAEEWEKVLEAAQEKPENFGSLPSNVPRSTEISQAYTTYQTAKLERDAMLSRFTKNHPDVRVKEKELEIFKAQFVEAVSRALATANGNLKSYRNQLAVLKQRSEGMRNQLTTLEQKIVAAEAGFRQLEGEKAVSAELYSQMLQKENEARIAAEQNNEIVRVGRPAVVPTTPVLPNPIVIFSAGTVLSLAVGLFFVLILDHLEDTIVSLADIEDRLALKVLAVFPHVRRKKREQVARFIAENKYSQFAEAVAGLRNLLDSPRYQPLSKVLLVMSTQPGEGKTITSCSIAISSAQAGKKTLLVDFDLRRPRMARVWGLKLDLEHSFSHSLSRKDFDDFASLANKTGVDNLDVIASLQPENVNPASIMGSQVVVDFFAWARENYDRVIIDSPPFGIVGDVMSLASLVDSVMIICCPDRTHFKPIQHASRSLAEAGATVIGIVVNDIEVGGSAFSRSGRGYGYSHSHGYGYGSYGGYGHYGSYGYGYGYGYGYRPKSKKNKAIGVDADAVVAGNAEAALPAPEGAADDDGVNKSERSAVPSPTAEEASMLDGDMASPTPPEPDPEDADEE